ncbi:MAG TPA: anaerobic sulfatase maturase [Bacteroidales bacterium]
MGITSREFQIFVKPVGPVCNLNCSYCYYLGKKNLYPKGESYQMPDDLLEKYVIQHIQATTGDIIIFSWHGGEPLLAGIRFFIKVVGFQKKHKPAGSTIINGIQTNGTLLDDEWCRFFAAEKFNVGISLDGPGDLHNLFRRSKEGNNTFLNTGRGYELLQKHGVLPEILCVVNACNVKHPLRLYNLFKQFGAEYISFLPLVEPEPDSLTGVSENSVPSGEFGLFLCTVFDEWVEKDIGKIKIQIFEEAARTAFNQEHTLCIFKVNCGGVPVVEHNGDFYSCDHYVDANHKLGNIRDHSLAWFLDSARQSEFGQVKSNTLPKYCIECDFRPMCNGECPKNRILKTPDGEPGLNYLCSGYKHFFNHCRPFVEAISEAWRNQRE